MAFRVIFIFRRIGADRMGYKCHIKKIAGYAHIGAIWNGECDYFGYCQTRERIMQEQEENEED